MSILFGVVKESGRRLSEEELRAVGEATQRFTPNRVRVATWGNLGMGLQQDVTHQRSALELQPAYDRAGNILTFDGRLDNYRELCDQLDLGSEETADSQIILSAFARWEQDCFSRFVGDWAMVLWSAREARLYLARDHAGTRTLYYKRTADRLLWSTYLDTFADPSERPELEERYAVRYLASLPSRDLTPYKNVTAVTPAHFLVIDRTTVVRHAHWNWIGKGRIRYQRDREYEDHFLELFRRSVERRTGAGAPILAHLSGGMDSSSIVCMSDSIRRSGGVDSRGLLDTISYYDDTEPHWDDGAYFPIVEQYRGKVGIHIDVLTNKRSFESVARSEGFYGVPGGDTSSLAAERALNQILGPHGFKVILSGIGGDELLGGVPTVLPQLADHLVTGKWLELWKLAMASSLSTRTPLFHVPFQAMHLLFHLYAPWKAPNAIPPWLTPCAVHALKAETHSPPQNSRWGALPSAIDSGNSWWNMLETLPHLTPGSDARYEYRYPYLDRDLVDFLIRVPREQLVRPGRRRSLMRRAMRGIVPEKVLARPRKGHISRSPLLTFIAGMDQIEAALLSSRLGAKGLVDLPVQTRHLRSVESSDGAKWVPALARAAVLESWLRSLEGTDLAVVPACLVEELSP